MTSRPSFPVSPARRRPSRRRALLAAALAAAPGIAAAQAPQARPEGGRVVAGQAGISQTPARTQVDQRSDRAVIEWQRFDVGAAHRVDIRQPGASSWSLQRVTGGDPSAIAGRVTSNGGVALVNPAGITFANGAQVDVAALIATTADITNEAFMAGRMAFDGGARPGQPARPGARPGARIENRGRITVADRGLAALVGPSVANAGTIRARLGRVALAGGEAFALDLAGDGLLALDVTRQVATAPSGAAALVTNTGTISAEGGSVLLTAHAASGVLETLVEAGGRIEAPTLAGRPGTVALRAEGGGLRVDGVVAATGGPALRGGTVEATGSGEVRLVGGTLVDVSGGAGGGRATIGAGAGSTPGRPQRLAARTVVERGAVIRADGRAGDAVGGAGAGGASGATGPGGPGGTTGPGGTVIVHAAQRTAFAGTATARGTPGGQVEVSSRGALALDGRLDAGADGQVLVDPLALRVVATLSGSTEPAEITAAAIAATTGALTLQAATTIRVEAGIDKPSGPLTLQTTRPTAAAGEGIQLLAPVRVAGDLVLRSAGDITQPASGAALDVGTLLARSRTGEVRLDAPANVIRALDGGGAATRFGVTSRTGFAVDGAVAARDVALTTPETITLRAPVTATGIFDLVALQGASQAWTGAALRAGLLRVEAPLGPVSLVGAGNRVTSLGDSSVAGGLSLANAGALSIAGNLVGGRVSLSTDRGDLAQDPAGSRIIAAELQAVAWQGGVLFDGTLNAIARLYGRARDGFVADAGGPLLLAAPVTAGAVELRAVGEIAQDLGARITAGRLSVTAIGGAVTFDDPLNAVASLGPSGAGGAFVLATSGALVVKGVLAAPSVSLTSGGDLTGGTGAAIGTALLRATSIGGAVRLGGPGHAVEALGGSGAATDFALASTGALRLAGPLEAGGSARLEAGALLLEAPVTAATLRLRATTGDVAQTASAPLAAGRLLAEAPAGAVRLDEGANAIGRFGGSAALGFALATAGGATAEAIAAPQVTLATGGDLGQAAGGIATDHLSLAAGGRVDLRAAANAIRSLGAVRAAGGLALATGTALRLEEPLALPSLDLAAAGGLAQAAGAPVAAGRLRLASAGAVVLDNPGNALPRLVGAGVAGDLHLVTAGGLAIEGPVTVGGTLRLQAADRIGQAAGGAGIEAARLDAVSLYGGIALDGAGNRIAALGGATAAGDLVLAQQGAAPLALAGLVVAPSLTLRPEAGLDDAAGGALRAGLLRLDTAGPVRLGATGRHMVAALGGRAGALALASDGGLAVTEPLAVAGPLLLSAGSLALAAPVAAGAARFDALAGDIAQAANGAGLTVGSGALVLHAAGAVALAGTGNAVARLAAGSAEAGFALASGGALTVAGPVAGSELVLRAGTTLTLDGAMLEAGRAVLLAAPGGIAAGAASRLAARAPDRLPVLILDTRRAGGLAAIPAGVAADLPGLAPAAQPTQLADFGPAGTAAAGPLVVDLAAGESPVFLLLDGGAALGVLQAGRLGLLGQGGSAFLLGTLGGVAGGAAAQGVAVAGAQAGYLFNTCVMGVAACGIVPPEAPPERPVPPEVTPPLAQTPPRQETGAARPEVTPVAAALPGAGILRPVPGISGPPLLGAADLRAPGGDMPLPWPPPAMEPQDEPARPRRR